MSDTPDLTELTTGSRSEADSKPRVVDFADEQADDVIRALSSATAREIHQQLQESPTHPSALAETTDTSVQNVHYHLNKLEAANVVEVVDTVYSAKGTEMSVYAPTAEPLVIVASDDDSQDLINALSELLGAIGVLAVGSVVVQELVERVFYPGGPTVVARDGIQYASAPVTNAPPPVGLYVFVVGLAVLLGWFAWRRR